MFLVVHCYRKNIVQYISHSSTWFVLKLLTGNIVLSSINDMEKYLQNLSIVIANFSYQVSFIFYKYDVLYITGETGFSSARTIYLFYIFINFVYRNL